LADFQQHRAEFDALSAEIVALSAEATSRTIGCYTGTHEGRPHIQPAAFILGPDGRIAHAVYSSGKVGRLTADDAQTIVKELRE
jgi:peroxiredoxin